ncbi:MAG: hypothetical protein NC218_12415 [Acetobacter sp.]|nr:hypothetical protein [Acetobacter sp.]
MDLFLLICHRSERSEVKRSRESMGGGAICNGASSTGITLGCGVEWEIP